MSDTGHMGGFDHENAARLLEGLDTGIDRRARRTRQALHQTLMRLIVERGYEQVTVADIAEVANVGRSTFYAHFTDKDDLLRSAAGNLKTIVRREHEASAAESGTREERVLGFSRFMTHHLYEQRTLFHALMKGQAGPIILDVMRGVFCDIVRDELAAIGGKAGSQPAREATVQFVVGSYIAVVTWWLSRGAKEKPETIHALYRALASGGISGIAG